ncbi:MAG: protein kinase [Lachnospiraceae bacterium]|nr:protein kinase [Lachnospiraceae bacterium]
MDVNKLCPKCMNETEGSVCAYCGFDREKGQENAHALKPYSILSGKYLIGNVIGEGGFGITYIGYDLNLEMKIAVKEFYPNGFVTRESALTSMVTGYTTNDPAQYQKWKDSFVREARSLAKFSNLPGIVHVRDFFQENNTAYIVMEYVEGETLKSYLQEREAPLSMQETLSMMDPVILSLSKVHASGIIHRDISPDNIMIQADGEIKLIDFGAAREFEEGNERSMSVLLKPGYAPEEQYRTKGEQGPWTDVYAISATIYRCITGVKPVESMERMRKDELKKPSEMGIRISPEQEAALLKGMAVFSENRIKSMVELKEALNGGLSGGADSDLENVAGGSALSGVSSDALDGSKSGDASRAAADGIRSSDLQKAAVDGIKSSDAQKADPNGIKSSYVWKAATVGIGVAALVLLGIFIVLLVKGKDGEIPDDLDDETKTIVSEDTSGQDEVDDNTDDKAEDEDEKDKPYIEDTGIHRYEYIIADVTWREAFRDALNRGGYLLHLNTEKEAIYVVEELNRKDLAGKSFFIGGARKSGSRDYYWLDPDEEPFGALLNDEAHRDYWLSGEPSFNSEDVEERYMDMIYRKKEGRWYWNDIPNDIISISKSFEGKIGYIVEYE